MLARHVVQQEIGRLGHQRIPETAAAVIGEPFEGRIAHHAHAAGAGDQDRRFQHAAFFHPVRAGHVAIAVAGKETGKHAALIRLAARKNRRHPGAHRAFAPYSRTFPRYQRLEADFDAGNIGDGIQRPRCAVEGHAQIAGAWARGGAAGQKNRRQDQMFHGKSPIASKGNLPPGPAQI